MTSAGSTLSSADEHAAVAAAQAGDETAFGQLAERYRRELQVHCYRMLGSFEDSEDLIQETFLRAWTNVARFEGRSTFRAWLYRIATNACLDFLSRHPRHVRPYQVPPGVPPSVPAEPPPDVPWLQPFPDHLLDQVASRDGEPDAVVVARETIELAFLVAIQHLPPRQRAVLILRDVLGWPAAKTADQLEMTVPAVKSALQRARPVLRKHLPERRLEWTPSTEPSEAEKALLRRYVSAMDVYDPGIFAELLSEDVRITMPPNPLWFAGRESFVGGMHDTLDPNSPNYFGEWRSLPTHANRQPAAAHYVRQPGDSVFRAQVLDVLRVENGVVVEITSFGPHLFAAFGLPPTL